MNYQTQSVNCNICGKNTYKHYATKFNLPLVKCKQCGLIYANPRLVEAEILKRYSADYFYDEFLPEVFSATRTQFDLDIIKTHYYIYLKLLENYFAPGKKLLDVGCGPGFFLRAAQENGWDVKGMEISEAAADYAERIVGIPVQNRKLEEIHYPENSFDMATLLDTIEHLSDPSRTLSEIHRVLKKDGTLILSTPDTNSLSRLFLGTEWAVFSPAEHLYNFTQNSLEQILKKTSFKISIIQSLFHFNPEYAHDKNTRRYRLWHSFHRPLEKNNVIKRLFDLDLERLFGQKIKTDETGLTARLKDIVARGVHRSGNKLLRGDWLVGVAKKQDKA